MLKVMRPIFHSEDDFKFSFSSILQRELGEDYEIRLERPQEIRMLKRDKNEKIIRAPIDIVVIDKKTNLTYPIELKYKTKKYPYPHEDEIYNLTEQGAIDIGRFSFRKDIYRLEQLINKESIQKEGFFIVITNEKKYFENVSDKDTTDKNFSFHDGMIIQKEDKSWNYEKQFTDGYILNENMQLSKNDKLHWTSKGDNFYKLDLKNTYEIKWQTYSKLKETEFYISVVEITKQQEKKKKKIKNRGQK
ncbi:hypothetical protein [Sulfuricurvum sp.]|uniref:hypothetical protein n=1 Tax=Sulfuricurvum sp. TaxID=2025608 RepID=UPI003BB7C49D